MDTSTAADPSAAMTGTAPNHVQLTTGARESELPAARWGNVGFARARPRLPETKATRVHYIPMSAVALALLRQMPRGHGSPSVLSGRGPRGASPEEKASIPTRLVKIDKPWRHVRKTAGMVDVRSHDSRRTVGSWLARSGSSLHSIGRALSHSTASTAQVYARFGEDWVKAPLERNRAWIMGAAGLTPSADVAHLQAGRCGTCAFWAEHHIGAPVGVCIAHGTAACKHDHAPKAVACRGYVHDDEAPDLATRTSAAVG